jgi:hypothetical protein
MTRGRPFQQGNQFSRGRPPGSKNKSTSVGRQLIGQHYESLIRKTIAEGMKDNTRSRLWLLEAWERRTPPTSKLKLPPIKTLDDIAKAFDVILDAVAKNKCTEAHGQALYTMLGERRKMIETQELASRLEEIEALVKKPGNK